MGKIGIIKIKNSVFKRYLKEIKRQSCRPGTEDICNELFDNGVTSRNLKKNINKKTQLKLKNRQDLEKVHKVWYLIGQISI